VSIKCPSCARSPSRARRLGKPRHYVFGGLAGAAAAALLSYGLILLRIGFFGFFSAILVGYACGGAVVRAASNQHHRGIQVTAGIATVFGLALGSYGAGMAARSLLSPAFLISAAMTCAMAVYRAGR